MNRLSNRALTWGTVIAALLSAWLLAVEDVALSELGRAGLHVFQGL